MKNLLLCCCLAALALGCSGKKTVEKEVEIKKTEDGRTVTRTTTGDTAAADGRKTGKVELFIKKEHIFSDPTKMDKFELELKGESLLNATILFTITNPQNELIFEDSLSAADLEASLVYTMKTDQPTVQQREEFVRKRLHDFFDEKNFSTPAVVRKERYNEIYGEQTAWEALKNDKNAVGFSYLVGKESGRRIAWSKLRKKVMLVGSFGG